MYNLFHRLGQTSHTTGISLIGIRVVSNAGGVNPHECANALMAIAKETKTDLKVAVVTGDELMGDVEKIRLRGIKDMDSGKDFPASVESMNAYLGQVFSCFVTYFYKPMHFFKKIYMYHPFKK